MDLEFLLSNYHMFCGEVKKYFDEDEWQVNSYKAKAHIIVLTSKRIFVYYFDSYIDMKYSKLSDSKISVSTEDNAVTLTFLAQNLSFAITFLSCDDTSNFTRNFEKYN